MAEESKKKKKPDSNQKGAEEGKKKKKPNSNQKGKRGELELAKIFKENGFPEARRSVQYNGKAENALCDVIGVDGFHIECKRVERLNVSKAMKQAVRDKEDDDIPIVCHRKSNEDWLVTMKLDDFINLIKKEK